MTQSLRMCKVAAMMLLTTRTSASLFTLMFGLLPLQLLAQTAPDTASEETVAEEIPQYYQVEMIVFRHADLSATTAEIPRMPEAELSVMLEQELARLSGMGNTQTPAVTAPGDEQPDEEITAEITESALPATAEEEIEDDALPFVIPARVDKLLLAATATRIDNLPPYELVSYLHWAQPAPDVTIAQSLDLSELGAEPSLLSGQVEIHQRRYLHLLVDISLNTDNSIAEQGPATTELLYLGVPETLPALKDSRRIRLEQMHYFDQPQFGVLAIISRYEFPAEEVLEEVLAEYLLDDNAADELASPDEPPSSTE
jgi:hypothetical protein